MNDTESERGTPRFISCSKILTNVLMSAQQLEIIFPWRWICGHCLSKSPSIEVFQIRLSSIKKQLLGNGSWGLSMVEISQSFPEYQRQVAKTDTPLVPLFPGGVVSGVLAQGWHCWVFLSSPTDWNSAKIGNILFKISRLGS